MEAYLARQEFHREKHYDFTSKQVLSVYKTFPRAQFPREDHRGKELQRCCGKPPAELPEAPKPCEVKEKSAEEEKRHFFGSAPRFPLLEVC